MKRLLLVSTLALGACHSLPKPAPSIPAQSSKPLSFAITGKIGITTQHDQGKSGGSVFYDWGQDGERFAIDLTGALGIGATQIRYDGKQATLTSEQTGLISAGSPSDLLTKATGWQAPIEVLPFWIMGQTAPQDHGSIWQTGKLTQSQNGDWTAVFDYNGNLPSKLIINHSAGHRVVMTITHVTK